MVGEETVILAVCREKLFQKHKLILLLLINVIEFSCTNCGIIGLRKRLAMN